ncbi:MAG: DUF1737 domain-containing protein [Candidatus Electrothrix sp. MAN1_4]|nr:DUF1737 domain-containing protein [Candidatus Electrothrix sp. MAN1_4]
MQYKVVTINTVKGLTMNFERAAGELADKVKEEIANGWEPIGGIATGKTQEMEQPYLFQAMVKR